MNKIVIFIILAFVPRTCFSQDSYQTVNGHVIITGKYNNTDLIAESHKLEVNYDSKKKSLSGKINLKSILSGDAFLDSLFGNSNSKISINANIPVDFLTWEHKQYVLDVPLEITINGVTKSTLAKIEFTHTEKLSSYTCIMLASFELDLVDFNIEIAKLLNPKIKVQFLQLILRRGGL